MKNLRHWMYHDMFSFYNWCWECAWERIEERDRKILTKRLFDILDQYENLS